MQVGAQLALLNSASARRSPENLTRKIMPQIRSTGSLQQRLRAAYAGEFDAKDHAKIPDDGGNRRPRAACQHFQIDFRERKLIDRSVEDFTARIVGANSVFEQSNPPIYPAREHVSDAGGKRSEGYHLPPTGLRRYAYCLERNGQNLPAHHQGESLSWPLLSHPSCVRMASRRSANTPQSASQLHDSCR